MLRRVGQAARREGRPAGQRLADRRRQHVCRARLGPRLVVGRYRTGLRRAVRRAAVQREPGRAADRAGPGGRRARHHQHVAAGSGLTLDHGVTTVAAGARPSRISLMRTPGSNLLRVSGQVALGVDAIDRACRRRQPDADVPQRAARGACAATASSSSGTPFDIDDLPRAPDMSRATAARRRRRRRSAKIVDVTLKWSRNIYAETMLHSMAPAARRSPRAGGLDGARGDAGRLGRVAPNSTSRATARGCRATTISAPTR